MTNDIELLLEESIRLELNVADLYMLFSDLFKEDAEFWWGLCLEEKNHAALLRSGRESFLQRGAFPEELVGSNLAELKGANEMLVDTIRKYGETAPTRKEAFELALHLEESAGEIHFQNAMKDAAGSPFLKVFQKLNMDDKDHARRIREQMVLRGL